MAAASGIDLTMPSGLDDSTIINELVDVQEEQVTTVQNQVSAYQNEVSAYGQIKSDLQSISSAASAVSSEGSFDVFSSTSSNADAVTIAGGNGSTAGQYTVGVYHLASSETMMSSSGKISSETSSLSSQGINVGKISVDGVNVTVSSTDTIKDLADNINSATKSDGSPLDVTASVVQVSSSDYRLVLSSDNAGSDGIAYKDVSGSTLQDLGVITDANGDKGNVSQVVQSSDDITDAWNNLATNGAVQITGTDHDGNAVSMTFTKDDGETLSDFLSKVTAAYNGTATATTNADGDLVLTDNVTGASDMALGTLSIGGTDHTMTVTQGGENGKGVLTAGTNSYYSIDGMDMNSDTNSVSGFQTGTTISLKATCTQSVTVGLTLDTSTIEQNIEAVLTAYNSLLSYVNSATQVATTSSSTTSGSTSSTQAGPLPADMTATGIVSTIHSLFESEGGSLSSSLTSLAEIGVKTDADTGKLSLDESTFETAMEKNPTAVENLFTQVSNSNSSKVTFGQSTSSTQSGNYLLQVNSSGQVQISQAGTNQWYTGTTTGDIVTFSSGPASGLSINAPSGSISDDSTNPTTFNFSNGLAADLTNTIANMTDANTGLIQNQTSTIQTEINNADDQITTLTNQCNQYRTQLTQEFSDMEAAVNKLKSASSSLTASFGSD